MTRTFVACGPLPDSPSSYSTFAPSASVRKPSPEIPEKCTNASLPPSSGVMNPKPFSSLNHFTTPVATTALLLGDPACARGAAGTAFPHTTVPPGRRPYVASCTSPDNRPRPRRARSGSALGRGLVGAGVVDRAAVGVAGARAAGAAARPAAGP